MEFCETCGTVKNTKTGLCPSCKAPRRWIWNRLGIVGSIIFILLGIAPMFFPAEIFHFLFVEGKCAEYSPSTPSGPGSFLDTAACGIGNMIFGSFAMLAIAALGLVLVGFGIAGLVIALILLYRKKPKDAGAESSK